MVQPRFPMHKVLATLSGASDTLRVVASKLAPHYDKVLNGWVSRQCRIWEPPGISREELRNIFGRMLRSILDRLGAGDIEGCLGDLSGVGAEMEARHFPYEALMISFHFLEESYLPYLLEDSSHNIRSLLVAMDEFLHLALATLATSYFAVYERKLVNQIEVGRVVQRELMPEIPVSVSDLEVSYIYHSAQEMARLGGDFIDHFSLSQSEVFIIGDLSGHGIEAIADSVMVRSLIRGFMSEDHDLARAMARVNSVLWSYLGAAKFATALVLAYERPGLLRLTSAGNPLPVICHGECRFVQLCGWALGVTPVAEYETVDVVLEPGGVFVAFTDGLTETRSGLELFGEERVLDKIREHRNAEASLIAEQLVDASLRHSGGKFVDDVAVMVLKRKETTG
jgi:serine phosphatase RsbU (regulator of sigma subunit)